MLDLLGAIPHPDIPPLDLGAVKLYPFGFLVGMAIIIGTIIADKRAGKLGLDRRVVSEAALWAVIPGFIVAHLYAVIFYTPEDIIERPIVLLEFWKGISSFGGFIGATGGLIYYFRKKKIPFFPYADSIIYGFAFAWIFGRLGCTIAFDHPGIIDPDFPLVMPYPDDPSRPFPPGLRHNLGFYEFLWALVISAVFWTQRKKARPSGWFLTVFVIAYMPLRFVADFLRVADKTYLGLTPGQYAAIALMIAGIWLLRTRMKASEMMVADGNVHIFADGRPALEVAKPGPSGGESKKKKKKKKK